MLHRAEGTSWWYLSVRTDSFNPLLIVEYWFKQKADENIARTLMKDGALGGAPEEMESLLWESEVTPEGGCERMWLRWGGVVESGVITAMSAKYWHCLEGKRKRRPSKRQREKEREIIWTLRGGDELVNGGEELFDLWKDDVLIILSHFTNSTNHNALMPNF